jgi:xanthine dehydrogenase accessory factor
MSFIVLLRGGGDIASGVALRLVHAGFSVVITELPRPMTVRRLVSFAQAVYDGQITVEDVAARRVSGPEDALQSLAEGILPILVDPQAETAAKLQPAVLVDGRMTKQPSDSTREAASLVIGLGPGFVAGVNCHAVVETNRGHALGRLIWEGPVEADTRVPEIVGGRGAERVLRSPADGVLVAYARIGEMIEEGQSVASVDGKSVLAPFRGILRGLIYPGLEVNKGLKIGDVDPRLEPDYSRLVSDKALAVGGGVLEAILSRPDLRSNL